MPRFLHHKFELVELIEPSVERMANGKFASLRFRRNQREGDRDSGGGIICLPLIKGRGTTVPSLRGTNPVGIVGGG